MFFSFLNHIELIKPFDTVKITVKIEDCFYFKYI